MRSRSAQKNRTKISSKKYTAKTEVASKELLSVSDAAKLLGVSNSTLRRLEDELKIVSIRQPNGYRLFKRFDLLTLKSELETSKSKRAVVPTTTESKTPTASDALGLIGITNSLSNNKHKQETANATNSTRSNNTIESQESKITAHIGNTMSQDDSSISRHEIELLNKSVKKSEVLSHVHFNPRFVKVASLMFVAIIALLGVGLFFDNNISSFVRNSAARIIGTPQLSSRKDSSFDNVLAAIDRNANFVFKLNVPAIFRESVTAEKDFTADSITGNTLTVNQLSSLLGGITTNNAAANFGTGAVTAGEVNFLGTAIINNLGAIDEVTETTLEEALDLSGDIESEGLSDVTIVSLNGAALGDLTTDDDNIMMVVSGEWTSVLQTEITQLGTITTGTWQGTAVGPTFGGTGLTSYTTGDLLYASAANTLSTIAITGTNGYVLTSNGTTPSWQTVSAVIGDAWLTTGNAGTDADVDFIGTTDNVGLSFRTNDIEYIRLTPTGRVGLGNNSPQTTLHIGNGSTAPAYVGGMAESQFIEGSLEVGGTIYGSVIGPITTTGFDAYGIFFADAAGTLTNDNAQITWNPTTTVLTVNGTSQFNGLVNIGVGVTISSGALVANGPVILGDSGDSITFGSTTMSFDDSNLSSPITLTSSDSSFDSGDTAIVDAINAAYNAATGGGDGLWRVTSGTLHPTSTTQNLSVGGSEPGAPFFFDTTNQLLTLTNTTSGNSFVINDVAGDTTPFAIDASGNVGIGTAPSSTYALNINGLTNAAGGISVFTPNGASSTSMISGARTFTGSGDFLGTNLDAYYTGSSNANVYGGAFFGYAQGSGSGNAYGVGAFSYLQSTSGSGNAIALNASATGLANSGGKVQGVYGRGRIVNPYTIYEVIGTEGRTEIMHASASTTNATNLLSNPLITTGTITNLFGLKAQTDLFTGGTVTNYYGGYFATPTAGTVTNDYGVVIAEQARGTNNTNLLVGSTNPVTGNFAIYSASAYNSYFASNVGIGTTNPAYDLDVNGDIRVASGSDYYVGSIGLNDTDSPTTSGAYLIGTNDEFTNSDSTNVQDVLDDLDAYIGTAVGNTHPALQLVGTPNYLSLNSASQILTQSAIDIASTSNVTGLLGTANGGTGLDASTAPSGSLVLGTGSGFNIKSMGGDATIDVTGSLTLANTGVSSGTYGSATGIPILTVDAKGRIISASTTPVAASIGGTGLSNYVARWTDPSTLGTGILYDNGTYVGVGTTNPLYKLDIAGTTRFQNKITIGTANGQANSSFINGSVTYPGVNVGTQHGINLDFILEGSGNNYLFAQSIFAYARQSTTGDVVSTSGYAYLDRAVTIDDLVSLYGVANVSNAGAVVDDVVGTLAYDIISGGTAADVMGFWNYSAISGGVIGDLTGLKVQPSLTGGTITNKYGVRIFDNISSGATITNNYGVYIEDMAVGSNNNFSIYSNGGTSYFADNVGIGTSAPAYKLDVNGDIRAASGSDFYVGTIGLNDTDSPTTSGAYLIGTNDEFANSDSTNVQDVLDDLDAYVSSAVGNTHPALQLVGTPNYLSLNAASQILTQSAIDIASTSNVTGLLGTANGGTGLDASTAPSGALVLGTGSGFNIKNMGGDAAIDQTGTLTLANTGVVAGSYGTPTAIPVLTIDSKGRILSASTVPNGLENVLTFSNGITRNVNDVQWGGEITQNTRLYDATHEFMYLQSATGYIGIGTTAPTNLLQIAGLLNLDGTDLSTFLGQSAGEANTTGFENVAIGYRAFYNNTTGSWNTAVGTGAMENMQSGQNNTALGITALYKNTGGDNNTAIGGYAGYNNVSGSDNIFIGSNAGADELGSNKLYIENTSWGPNGALIYGDFTLNTLTFNGNVGIGITNPAYDLDVNGDIRIASGSDLYIGTTGLNDTASPTTSGGYLVGVNDEFTNSSSTNVQDVLDDLDAYMTSAVGNTHPALQLTGTANYLSLNAASQILTQSAIDIASTSNVTGLLGVANGGLGISGATAPSGSLVLGTGSGFNIKAMGGDATIDVTGSLTLANSGVTAATYGSATGIPILTVDAKGRIISASTTPVAASIGGTGLSNYVARWTDNSTLSTGRIVDNGTYVGIGVTNPLNTLEVAGTGYFTSNLTTGGDYLGVQGSGAISFGSRLLTQSIFNNSESSIGTNWTATSAATQNYANVAISADGRYQTAVSVDTGIHVSTNYGVTWAVEDSTDRDYVAVAMSSDGKYQTAVVQLGGIYVSTDHGVTWNVEDSTSRMYNSVAMSSDGKYQTAVVFNGGIYVSTDYGVTWGLEDSTNRNYYSVAISSDGRYQTAVVATGRIYVSTDYGVTWAEEDSNNRDYYSVAMSANGKYQTAVVFGGGIYVSTDYGVTWAVEDSTNRNYFSVDMSADGKFQTAVVYGGGIYVSTDYGVTWTIADSNSRNYRSISMSADGKYQTAALFTAIYSSAASSFVSGGNIGIGTTNPDSRLHIVGGDFFAAADSGYSFGNASSLSDIYVQGNLEVDGTIYGSTASLGQINLAGDIITDFTGDGLTLSSGALTIDATTTSTTSTTASNSGLEVTADGLRMLGGCSSGELLTWDSGAERWRCNSVSGIGAVNGSGAVGQVTFWDGASSLTGSDDFFWNSATSKLGLGTTNPSALLTLEPTDANALLLNPFGGGAGNTSELRFAELTGNGTNYTGFKAPDSLAYDITYTLPSSTAPADYVLTYQNNGTLEWKDITGVGAAGDITAVGSMTSGAVFADSTADEDWLGLGAAAGRILFRNQTTDVIALLNANVGIGTTAPAESLQVVGNAQIGGSSVTGYISFTSTPASKWKFGANPFADTGGMLTSHAVQLGVFGGSTQGFQIVDYDSSIPVFEVSGTGNVHVAGNVGIGTTNPAYTLDVNGDIRIVSGSDLYIGTIGLNDTASPTASGAYLVGVNDEFAYSAGTNVQDVLDDLDAAIGTAVGDTHPALQLSGTANYLSLDGTNQILTQSAIDIASSSNVTGLLGVANGGLGISGATAPSGSLVLGTGNGFNIKSMGGDATIDVTGSLTLANSGVTAATYGSSLGIPVLTIDAKGRITSASTAALSNITDGTGVANYVARWTDNNTLSTGVLSDTGTNVGIGITNPTKLLIVRAPSGFNDYIQQWEKNDGTVKAKLYMTDSDNTSLTLGAVSAVTISGDSSGGSQSTIKMFSNANDWQFSSTVYGYFSLSDITNSRTLFMATSGSDIGLGGNITDYTTLSGAHMVIDYSSGNVGIGNSSPTYKLDVNGDIRIASGSDLYIGTIGLNDTDSPTTSGAYLIGTNDEFTNSDSANVQDVLDDLDAYMTSAVGNTHPALQLVGTSNYLSLDTASQILTQSAIDIASSSNVTGLLGVANGGLGISGATAPSGSLVLGTGSGFNIKSMGGDATIDVTGSLTLANSGVTAATYGSATGIPVLTVDAKGRIISASTSPVAASIGGTGLVNYVARWTDTSTLSTGTLYDNGTDVGIGTTAPLARLMVDVGGSALLFSPTTDGIIIKNTNGAGSSALTLVSGATGTSYINFANSADEDASQISIDSATDTFRLRLGTNNNRLVVDNLGNLTNSGTLTVSGAGESSIAGNLGIGTTDPAYKLDVNGDIRIASGSDLYIGTIGLNDTDSPTTSGAYLIGTNDEFTNSDSANVQDVLDDLDAYMTSAVGNTHPALQLAGTANYLSLDAASQILTQSAIDIASTSNVTGLLGVANGGLGISGATAPSGSLVLGTDNGFNIKSMGGDATIDVTGSLTLANTGVSAATYGSSLGIPVLTIDAKGRITSASTAALSNITDGTGIANYVARWTDNNTLSTGVLVDTGTEVGIGTTNPSSSKVEIFDNTGSSDYQLLLTKQDNQNNLYFETSSNTDWHTNTFTAKRSRGTLTTKTAVQPDDYLFNIAAQGYGTTAYYTGVSAAIYMRAEQAFTDSNGPAYIQFLTRAPDTAGTPEERLRIEAGGNIGVNNTNPAYRLDVNGDIRVASGSDYYVGTIGLNDTATPTTSGAYLIGTNDEFTNSDSANVQDVLDDLDAYMTSAVGNTHPALQLTGAANYLSLDGTNQILTQSAIDIASSSNVTGLLGVANGGLGISGATAPSGALVLGTGSGFNIKSMGGDATIDVTGSLTLADTGVSAATYGSTTGIPILTIDAKGRITSASTAPLANMADGTGIANYVARWTDNNTLSTGLLYDTGTYVGIGNTVPAANLDIKSANLGDATLRVTDGAGYVFNFGYGASQTSGLYFNMYRNVSNMYFEQNTGGYYFKSGGNTLMSITTGGNVGIGTTNPDSKLHLVAGDIHAAPNSGYTFDNASANEDLYIFGNLEVDSTSYLSSTTIGGTFTINSENFTDLSGDGLTVSSNALTIDATTTSTTSVTASNSGLEVTAGGLRMLGGCSDNQTLSWDSSRQVWECTTGGGGSLSGTGSAGQVTFWDGAESVTGSDEFFWDTGDSQLGIGTTNPSYKLDVVSTTTTGALNVTADSVTTGTGSLFSFDGLTSGTGLSITSTATALTGALTSIDWSPVSSSTATGDLFKINVGANGVLDGGNILAIYDDSSALFTIDQSLITSYLPHTFAASGDVSVAHDIQFTNQTSSYIESYASLYLVAGESFESNNLTLRTYNNGDVVLDAAGGVTLSQAQTWDLATSTSALNFSSYLLNLDTTNSRIGIGVSNPQNKLDVSGNMVIGSYAGASTAPTNGLLVSGSVGIGTTAPGDYSLNVNGNARVATIPVGTGTAMYFDSNNQLIQIASSEIFKDDIQDLNVSLADVMKLNPVTFEWNEKTVTPGVDDFGLIAEEVNEVLPYLVHYAADGVTPRGIKYDRLGVVLLGALQEQQLELDSFGQVAVQTAQLQTDVQTTADQLTNTSTGFDARITNLETDLAQLSQNYDNLGITLGTLDTEVDTVTTDVALIKELLGLSSGTQSTESTESSQSTSSFNLISLLTDPTGVLNQIEALYTEFKDMVAALGLQNNNGELAVTTDLNVTGSTTLSDLVVTGDLMAGLIEIDSLNNSIGIVGPTCYNETLGTTNTALCDAQSLYLQKELAGNVNLFNGKVVIEPNGNMTVNGTISAEKVVADEFSVKGSSTLVGSAVITAGQTEIIINNTDVKANSKIFVTATSSTNGQSLIVLEKTAGTSFKVGIDLPYYTDISFDWWILNVE